MLEKPLSACFWHEFPSIMQRTPENYQARRPSPIAQECGDWNGECHIEGGCADGRQALYYMATLSCVKHSEKVKEFYNWLLQKGKKKVALIEVDRKLLVTSIRC